MDVSNRDYFLRVLSYVQPLAREPHILDFSAIMSAAAAPTPGDPTATASGIPSLDDAVESAFTSIKEEVRSKLEAFHTTEATRRAELTAKLQAVINKLKEIVPAPEPALSLEDIVQQITDEVPVTADETKNVDKLIKVINSAWAIAAKHLSIGGEVITASVLARVIAKDDAMRKKIYDAVQEKMNEFAKNPDSRPDNADMIRQIAEVAVNAAEPTTSHPNPRMLFPHMTTATASTPLVSSAPAPARYIPPAPPSPFASSKRKTDAFFKL